MERVRKAIAVTICALMATVLLAGSLVAIERVHAYWVLSRSNDIDRAAAIAPFDTRLLFIRSLKELYWKKDCAKVIETLERALELQPHYWDAMNNLAICYAIEGGLNDAKKKWEQILEEWPFYERAEGNLREMKKGLRPNR